MYVADVWNIRGPCFSKFPLLLKIKKADLQAVEASELVAKGNVNLQKAIKLNSSTRKIMFCFFLIASLLLLFFDWWSA